MSDLATGLADHLATNGIGTYKPTGAYEPTETGVYLRVRPQAADAIVLTEYPISDAGGDNSDSVVGIQIWIRKDGGHPGPTKQLGKNIFALLHDADDLTLDGTEVVQILRQSAAYLGQDDQGRHTESHNYYLNVSIPTPHRTD